jgi:heat shock protein HslJ
MRNCPRLMIALLATLAVGCAGSSPTPTAPSRSTPSPNPIDQVTGTWRLVSIGVAGQADEPAPPGAAYTITFADGRLSTRVDCNVCNGGFTLSWQTLTAGPALACTRAACPTMAFEHAYTTLLGGDSLVTVSDDALVLSSARGLLRFTR